MKVTINPVLDMETLEFVSDDGQYEYSGPMALFNRSVERQAGRAAAGATQAGNVLGSEAGSIFGLVEPTLARQATAPPGFSPVDLSTMQSRAQEAANATAAANEEQAKLRALRSRNPAGIQSSQDAITQAASRAQGNSIQGIQSENAQLKERQRQEAFGGLTGLYDTNVSGMLRAMGLVPEDLNTQLQAGKSGWLQNTLAVADTLGSMGKNATGAYKDIYG